MICPKCGSQLRRFDGVSMVSGLARQEGNAAIPIVGESCIMCGFWREAEVEAVMPDVPPRPARPARKQPAPTVADRVVNRYWASVTSQIKCGTSLAVITRLLRVASGGENLRECAVKAAIGRRGLAV